MGERRRRHDLTKGIGWKTLETESKGKGATLPWKVKLTNQLGQLHGGKEADSEKIKNIEPGELAIFTDGSLRGGKVGFGIAAYTAKSIEEGKTEWEEAASMEGKDIMDAETWAIIKALHIANGTARNIRIFTDSRNAKEWILNPRNIRKNDFI